MDQIKIAILDDHQVVVDGIRSLLHGAEPFEIIGWANTERDLILLLEQQDTDLLILDMFLPKPEGIGIMKSVLARWPNILVLVMSGNSEEELLFSAFNAGASAFLGKDVSREELLLALHTVLKNEKYIAKSLESNLSRNFMRKATMGDPYASHKAGNLSKREIETMLLLCEGLSYKEIGHQLEISARTVETHKNNILEKLGLHTTIDLVKYAIKNKMIEL
jgi:DNA-binding NarL/FixJ family response regulator